jgi:hypothetical protein
MSPIRYGSTSQPFWSFHPACLYCNWDAGEWVLAAHLGSRTPKKKHPEWYTTREYVAWLCEDCAAHGDRVRWFADTVADKYPHAMVVQSPGTQAEREVPLKALRKKK